MKSKPVIMTVDIETTGLDFINDKIHGIGVGYGEGTAEYYPIWDLPEKIIKDLEDPKIFKLGQNFHSFDAKFIKKHGINIRGLFHDTKVLGNLCDPDMELGLKPMSARFIGKESLERKRRLDEYLSQHSAKHVGVLCQLDLLNPEHPHFDIIAEYCKEDVENTTTLFHIFMERLEQLDRKVKKLGFKKSPLDYYWEEAIYVERVLFEMEYKGIKVDVNAIEEIKTHHTIEMKDIERTLSRTLSKRIRLVEESLAIKAKAKVKTEEAKAKRIPGQGICKFEWSNNNHIGQLLYEFCDVPKDLIKRTKRGYRTDKAAIEILQVTLPAKHRLIPCLKMLAEYKLHAKIVTTYTGDSNKGIVSKIRIVNGEPRIFPEYRQTTGTGRLACRNPNMQNLKRDSEIKRFFIPDNKDEVFDDFDYSQIELRTGAHVSNDPSLIHAYEAKEDVHLRTASRLFGREIRKSDELERQAGKRTNFLTIFDGGPHRLQAALKADTGKDFTLEECEEFIKIWFETYPQVREYLDDQLEFFKEHKFCISATGRLRWLRDIDYGKYLHWVNGKPEFKGSFNMRKSLIEAIRKDGKPVTEVNIGWAAKRKYSHAIKAGYNQPIQGLAASITKRSMIELFKKGILPSNQVHDSLTISRKRGDLLKKRLVKDIMENTYKLSVPVEVDCKTLNSFHPKDKSED